MQTDGKCFTVYVDRLAKEEQRKLPSLPSGDPEVYCTNCHAKTALFKTHQSSYRYVQLLVFSCIFNMLFRVEEH